MFDFFKRKFKEKIDENFFKNEFLIKKTFETIIKENTLKSLEEKIENIDIIKDKYEENNLFSLSDEFMLNIDFKKNELTDSILETLRSSREDFVNEIFSKVKEKVSDLTDENVNLTEKDCELIELKSYIEVGMEKTMRYKSPYLNNYINDINDLEKYSVNFQNLSRGDLKALYNILSNTEKYDNDEIKNDLIFQKIISNEDMSKEKFNDLYEKLEKSCISLKENFENEKIEENFKLKILEKILKNEKNDFTLERKEITDDISKNVSNEKLIKKYSLENKLPIFKVILDEEIFESENLNVSDNLKNKIISLKGQEFFDDMNITDIRDWDKLETKEILFKDENDFINYNGNYEQYISSGIYDFLCNNYLKNKEEKILEKTLNFEKKDIEKEIDFSNKAIKNLDKKIKELNKEEDICKKINVKFSKIKNVFEFEKENKQNELIEQEIDNKKEIEKDF